jgi:glycosyltransferase involved in cell wall biosynthesis
MKIVWVSHDHGLSGGAELCLWEGTRGLVAGHHEVRVVVPSHGKLAERLEAHQIPVSILRYQWWVHSSFRLPVPRLWRNLRASAKLAALLEKVRPDVVISNTLTVPVGAFAARKAGIPHVWYIHEFGFEDHGVKFDLGNAVSLAFIRRLSDKVIVNSRAVYGKFRRSIPESKLRVLHYAVDVPAQAVSTNLDEEPFRLILVGRICSGKRQEDAIRAVARLAARGITADLRLLGNENVAYGSFLRQLAQSLKVEKQIEFLPFAQDPFAHVARSHVALMCSISEAFGRVTIEAMKHGKPVIGADTAATSELIQNGVTGFLYRPEDAEDLSLKIEALYRNRLLLTEMGKNARDWSMRTFSMRTHTTALLSILEEAIADCRKTLRQS